MSLPAQARLDLHMHSLRSDGLKAPETLVEEARRGGLDLIAITDHDCEPDLPHGPQLLRGQRLHLLHAVELSGMHAGHELHLLVYFPGEMPVAFRQLCRRLCRARALRYEQACEAMGCADLAPPDEDARQGRRALTRTHLSRELVERGHARDLSDAWQRFTSQRRGLVPEVEPAFTDLIAQAAAHGGLSSWAHPSLDHLDALPLFVAAGLRALETARPRLGLAEQATLQRLAHKHGLLQTGGSDHHGFPGQRPLGHWSFPMRQARPWAQALGLTGA